MNDEIINKIKRYTKKSPSEEAHIVYVLVQIGKIIEREELEEKFPILCFYRNWVVHPQLDRNANDGRRDMLIRINDAIEASQENNEKVMEWLAKFADAISIKEFSFELTNFFSRFGLEDKNLDSKIWLKDFYQLLINILIDLPLKTPKDSSYVFEEFCFEKINNPNSVNIRIKLKSGEIYDGAPISILINGQNHVIRIISESSAEN